MNYKNWKDWNDGFGEYSSQEKSYYKTILSKLDLKNNTNLLEIGFGNGPFMGYCKDSGYKIDGVEIIPELVSIAKDIGFDAYSDISKTDKKYSAIFLFDVFEHIKQDDMESFFNTILSKLDTQGYIIARVPNCGGVFGGANQYGDITHVTQFSIAKFGYYAKMFDLDMVYASGDIYPYVLDSKRPIKSLERLIARFFYLLTEKYVRFVFRPQSQGVLSSNLFVIMRIK